MIFADDTASAACSLVGSEERNLVGEVLDFDVLPSYYSTVEMVRKWGARGRCGIVKVNNIF